MIPTIVIPEDQSSQNASGGLRDKEPNIKPVAETKVKENVMIVAPENY